MKRKSLVGILFSAAVAVLPSAAMSHGDDDHKDGLAQHGGQYQEVDGHHGIEMVASPDVLTFHLTEDHKPMDVSESSFKAIVQTDAGTKMVPLGAKDNALVTKLEGELPAGAVIVLTGKDKHGHAIQARFVKK